MSKYIYKQNIKQMLDAVSLCREKGYITSCLILLYSAIDCMAALGSPAKKKKASRKDFIDWSQKYIIPYLDSDCTPLELYAARCGVVHTYQPDSNLSNDGNARKIYYAWGQARVKDLNKSIEFMEKEESHTSLQVEVLIEALKKGIQDFEDDILGSDMESIVYERARNFFINFPKSEIQRIMPIIENNT